MLVVLVLLWGAFIVYWLRSHAQASFGNSVGSFRRDLHVLERTAPATMRPANRLRSPQPSGRAGGALNPPRAAGARPGATRNPPARSVPGRQSVAGTAHLRRRQSVRRRRDVLFLMTLVVVATLIMAGATRSHALIGIQLVADCALAGYVGLLVRMRNLATERDLKLSYLPRARTAPPIRRRYEEAGLSYGELSLRQAAN